MKEKKKKWLETFRKDNLEKINIDRTTRNKSTFVLTKPYSIGETS